MAKKNRSSWSGNEWKKGKGSSFGMPANPETPCEKQEPVNKLYKQFQGNEQVRGDGQETQLTSRIAVPGGEAVYPHGIRKYNPFDYRPQGIGEDNQGTRFDRTLATRPTAIDRKALPPMAYRLSEYGEQFCLTKHEGRAWVYTPESLSHYFSQWKRYQKSLSLQPQALVVDPDGESIYRFFSTGSPYGYWDVKVGTLIEGAAALQAPAQLIEFCASPIVVDATVQPETETATWSQIAGVPVPFAQFERGERLEIYRTIEQGPFTFQLDLPGDVNPLSVQTIVETSPRDFPEGYGFQLAYLPSLASNPSQIPFLVNGCGVTGQQSGVLSITFDPPSDNDAYVTGYRLEQLDSNIWSTVDTSDPTPRQFDGVSGGPELRIITFFDVASRQFQSVSDRFTFNGDLVDVAASDCSRMYGMNSAVTGLTQFTGISKAAGPDNAVGYGMNSVGQTITRFTGISKDAGTDDAVGYGFNVSSTFTRTDFGGVVIG